MSSSKLVLTVCLFVWTLPAHADISNTTGDVEIVSAPGSVRRNVYTSNIFARIFLERAQQDEESVPVNAVIPGRYNAYSDFQDAVIQDPRLFDTYFLHFDPIGAEALVAGTITFTRPMLGVIGRSLTMEQTDNTLGAIGTLYPTNRFDRELEYQPRGNYDHFEMSDDMRTLSFRLRATDLDQLRIVVTSVPEPGSLVIIACVLGIVLCRRRPGEWLQTRD